MTVWDKEFGSNLVIVGVTGRLDQVLTPQLEDKLLNLLDTGHYHLLVDMSEVTYINSSGLRVLVTAWRGTRQNNGNLILCGLNRRVHSIFSMVGFDKVFQIYASCEQAKAALEEG